MNSLGLEKRFIDFVTIKQVWSAHLWPNRTSPIETHSAMTWPYGDTSDSYNMKVFEYTATFFGVYLDGTLVGVNSGHKTSENLYRSRGLWVDLTHRRKGIAQMLFNMTQTQALEESCSAIWSIPRKTALSAYQRFGFETVGGFFGTETSDANIYVIKNLR